MTVPAPDTSQPAVPFEYGVVLNERDDWHRWNARHPGALSADAITRALDAILTQGIVDHPLEAAVPARALQRFPGTSGDIVYARETSALRALLTALQDLSSTEPEYSRRRVKVLAKGLLQRHVGRLRKARPFIVSMENEGMPPGGVRFDLVLADLSELRPGDIIAELSQLAEHLSGHGRLLATLPFSPEPENPAGHGVSWSVIDELGKIGFGMAAIRWYASQSRGILGRHRNGVFLVDARKSPSRESLQAPFPEGVIGLMGLPRSGTTMLTALLGANSGIHGVYEPWNANINRYSPIIGVNDIRALGSHDPFDLSVEEFITEFDVRLSPAERWLLVKETTTLPPYTDAMAALLSKWPRPARRHLVWLVRKPFHVYLSELEARRKWWGVPDIAHSREVFEKWATRTLRSVQRLRALLRQCDASIVSYEALARDTHNTVERLMMRLGIPFEAEQLTFHKTVKRSVVKGDLGVAKNPQAVSDRSLIAREQEFDRVRDSVADMPLYAGINQLAGWADTLAARGVIAADDELVTKLDDIAAPPPPATAP